METAPVTQPANGSQPQPAPPKPDNAKLVFSGKLGEVLNLPATGEITDKTVNLYVQHPDPEPGHVHWGWVVGGTLFGIGAGVGLTFASQAIWGGDDDHKKMK